MKKLLIVLSILLVALLLFGCAKKDVSKEAPSGGQVVRMNVQPAETTPIDNDMKNLDSESSDTSSVDSTLDDMDKDLESI